jgi:hypothetical protein
MCSWCQPSEAVKKLKIANCHPFIFNGLEHAQSPVFDFFHSFSPLGRGWPAAGAFTSRSGPGEGLLGRGSNTRVKQSSNAPFCS